MGKASTNSITSLNQDWGHDTDTNLPFSGEAVQNFIKSYLRSVTGAAWFNPSNYTMYFFASAEDRDTFISDPTQTTLVKFSCPMNFSSTMYRVDITNNTGTTIVNTATNATSCPLSASFVVQTKSITDQAWTNTQTGCYVTIGIDRGLSGNYETIAERTLYASGATINIDAFSYLALGTNRVRYFFEAEDGTVTGSLVYTINLAELYVELFSNTWYQPILQSTSDSWYLGGFRIAGAGFKTLHISLFNASGTKVVDDSRPIGNTNAYVSTPYYFRWTDSSNPILALNTGVYTVRAYVSTDQLSSETIEYKVMYVRTSDATTAKLVCINSVPDKIYNYSTSVICQYAIYNGNSSTGSPTVRFARMNGQTEVDHETKTLSNIQTATLQNLEYSAEWGVEGTGYAIAFTITLGSASASASVPLDNSTVFPPTAGFAFYMNPSARNNNENSTARKKIVNEANGASLSCNWTDVDFIDGIDGWTVDQNGRKCLRIAGWKNDQNEVSHMSFPYTSFQMIPSDNITFEICYRISNVSDYDAPVITIAENRTSASFKGLRIKPTNITLHSANDTSADIDSMRGTNVCDEEIIHLVITINPNFEGSHKIVKGYVNGCKNFEFSYAASVDWPTAAPLWIGSDKCDVEVFFIRQYAQALSDAQVQSNYINSLTSVAERTSMSERQESVLDLGGTEVDFENVKNNDFNFFIVHMEDNGGVPSAANGWGKTTKKKSSLEMHFGKHPDWDWKIEEVETMGQGTTSMNYYRWNIRWRIDKSNGSKRVPVSYLVSRTKSGNSYRYTWGTSSTLQKVRFDGTQHPEVMRITAKINQASSMQSHKMGATRAYTELHDAIGLENEAQAAAGSTKRPVVAVYQYPAFGFEYNETYNTYTFIGLFTIGPDKGDKPTFGFDWDKNHLISMEGTDHSQLLAKFAYPWNNSVNYFYTQEGLAINMGNGVYETGLEIGNCHGKNIDKSDGAADESAIRGILVDEFKPAYELAWKNSTMIFPVSPSTYGQSSVEDTLAYINSHLSGETPQTNFRVTTYGTRFTYADMQFWIDGDSNYTLYYFDIVQGIYVAGDSLKTEHGTPTGSTADAKNEWFKAKRRQRFMASAENWWDIQDALYHMAFCIIFGATDNFAKNSYPYKMATQASGGRWKWRQDDLDTIFDIDNSGRDTKPYQIEYTDAVDNSPYFAGSNSVFWNLIYECYWNDYTSTATSLVTRGLQSLGRDVIRAMKTLSGKSNDYEGFVGYIQQCFWDRAQAYFPESAYNVDGNFKYEQAWLVNGQSVDPLTQALGNHYSGEMLWVQRRAVYMMSLFKAGPFGDYSDKSLGTISFRPLGLSVALYPAMWLYPSVAVGQNTVLSGGRTSPTGHADLSGAPDGNTEVYIQGANYLISLGDLKALQLGSQYINVLTIIGKKLQTFVMGSTTANSVTTNVPGLIFSNTYCLETIDLRNASSIAGSLDLTICRRLRKLYLIGSSITTVSLPVGSKLDTIALPATLQSIMFRKLKHLSYAKITTGGYTHISSFFVDGCDFDAFSLLSDVVSQSNVLVYVRAVWTTRHTDSDSSCLNIISELTKAKYKGLTPEQGILDKPMLEGEIRLNGTLHADDIDALDIIDEQTYSQTLVKAQSGLFNSALFFLYNPSLVYISFVDSNVETICATNWGTAGVGVTQTQASAATGNLAIGIFSSNANIDYFNELKYFGFTNFVDGTGTTGNGVFAQCTNLKEITLPANLTKVGFSSFQGCTSLQKVVFPERSVTINREAFYNCSSLTDIGRPIISSFGGYGVFKNCSSLVSVDFSRSTFEGVSGSTTVANGSFNGCSNLVTVILPTTCTWFGSNTFYGCTKLKTVRSGNTPAGELNLPNLTGTLNTGAFYNTAIEKITSLGTITTLSGTASTGEQGVFKNCTKLTSVVLPNTLTTIQIGVFHGCTNLETINFPTSITSIGARAFQNDTKMTGELNLPNLTYIGNAAFYYTGITKILSLGSITAINSDTSAASDAGAFRACTNLTSVVLPSTCTTLGISSFYNCYALTTINTQYLTYLGLASFENCTSLVNLVFPAVVTIATTTASGWGVFTGCTNLESIDIGQNCTQIGRYAFRNCSKLNTVICRATTPPNIITPSDVFTGTPTTTQKIYVPYGYGDTYKGTTGWSSVASRIYELDENGNIPT